MTGSLLLAASGHAQTGRVLLDILVILVAAKVAAELAERVSIPAVAAEIVAGILLGPSLLGVVQGGEVLVTLAELGVILLLLEVGMHMDLRELALVGQSAMSVAVIGVIAPFGLGLVVSRAFGLDQNQTLFVSAALTATSVGITARVFGDMRRLATIEARTVLGAAIADDVIGLIILTVVTRIATGDGPVTVTSLAGIVVAALGFLILATTIGVVLAPKVFTFIERHARTRASLFALALAFALGVAQLATLVKLAPIIGAFVAGLSLGRASSAQRIQRELTPVGHLLIPVFFLQIGINVDARQFIEGEVLALAGALSVVAIVGKTVAGWAARGASGDRLTIGLAMVPRGEVGLIFASIGAASGAIAQTHYAAILVMVLVTTLVTPALLGWRIRRLEAAAQEPAVEEPAKPGGGWLVVANDQISLAGSPAQEDLITIALPAALAMTEGRAPDEALVSWILRNAPGSSAGWSTKTTGLLLRLLDVGTPQAWRFLETTGVLAQALPELAVARERRRSDPMLLDPAGVDRFPTVDKVRALRSGTTEHADEQPAVRVVTSIDRIDRVLLAALLIDCCDNDQTRANSVLARLCLDEDDAIEVGRLFTDRDLLLANAVRPDGLSAESVLRLAVHLGDEQRAAALYVLALAIEGTERWERAALAELHETLSRSLAGHRHGVATATILEAKRRDIRRLANSADHALAPHALHRVESAPISYLLDSEPEIVVTHLELLKELSRYRQFAAEVIRPTGTDPGWILLAAYDSPGLLARSTGVLDDLGLTIESATVATWTDGTAVQTFSVRPTGTFYPIAAEIERGLVQASLKPLTSAAVHDAVIAFDSSGSPWHTLCEVRATDRPGLLHAIASAFATAGIDVHGARISTADELALDTFELTLASGAKLTMDAQQQVEALLYSGVSSAPRRRGRIANTLATRPKQSRSAPETTRS